VRGSPTTAEIAALVTVLAARRANAGLTASPAAPVSAWADPAKRMRRSLPVGPGAWHRSALPG